MWWKKKTVNGKTAPANNQNSKKPERAVRTIKMAKIIPFMVFAVGAIILWVFFNKFIAIGFLGLTAGSFFLQGLRNIPASPPYYALLTILGNRVAAFKKEGWGFFPFYPLLIGFILQERTKINIDLESQEIWTPDDGLATVPVSTTITPDSDNLIEFFNSGGRSGVENILKDIIRQSLRQWGRSTEEGPQSLEEALGAQEEAVLILLKSILGAERKHVPSTIPTTILMKYFEAGCKKPFPGLSISEKARYEKGWDQIVVIIKEECEIPEDGDVADTYPKFKELRDAINERQKELAMVAQGNGKIKCPALGIILNRLNVGEIKPDPDLAKAMKRKVQEERERVAETIELTHVKQRIREFMDMDYSLGEAREIVQTERGKVKKEIQEKKYSVSQETIQGFAGLFKGKE